MVNATPRLPYPWKTDPVPNVQEAGWTPGPVGKGAENLATTGIRSPDRAARSEWLYRLSNPANVINIKGWLRKRRSPWPSGLRRGSAAYRLLGLRVRIPPGTWMSVCCECCVLSGRGLGGGPIPRPEESYRLWYVTVCDVETS
jgi:hypothetical protein